MQPAPSDPWSGSLSVSPRAKWWVAAIWLALTVLVVAWFEWRADRRPYARWIDEYSRESGIDPALVEAVILTESGQRPTAVSHKGAIGLMQIMPATARDMGERIGIGEVDVEMLEDPEINVRLGVAYLAWLSRRYDSLELTLAAYNAGPGRVGQWRKEHPELTPRALIEEVAFEETREYVARVLERYRKLSGRSDG